MVATAESAFGAGVFQFGVSRVRAQEGRACCADLWGRPEPILRKRKFSCTSRVTNRAGGAVKRYSGGGGTSAGGLWRHYTDDSAGLKM